jgi:hypothetical protein
VRIPFFQRIILLIAIKMADSMHRQQLIPEQHKHQGNVACMGNQKQNDICFSQHYKEARLKQASNACDPVSPSSTVIAWFHSYTSPRLPHDANSHQPFDQ